MLIFTYCKSLFVTIHTGAGPRGLFGGNDANKAGIAGFDEVRVKLAA